MKRISFENYKAFTRGDLELRPLTLLLGANSSGKSSILNLLLLLAQTVNNAENYKTALKTYGTWVNLGEDLNLLKDRNRNKTLSLEFGIAPNHLCNELKAINNSFVDHIVLGYFLYLKESFPDYLSYAIDQLEPLVENKTLSGRYLGFGTLIADDSWSILPKWLVDEELTPAVVKSMWSNLQDVQLLRSAFNSLIILLKDSRRVSNTTHNQASIRFEFRYGNSSRKLNISLCEVILDNKSLISIRFLNRKTFLSSSLLDQDSLTFLSDVFHPGFYFNGLSIKTGARKSDQLTRYVKCLVDAALEPVDGFFSKKNFKFIGPLRAYPQRYYMLDDSNANQNLDILDGSSLAEVLKKNSKVKQKVNEWMRRFGLALYVKEYKDFLHNIKVTQNGLLLDIPDVGFGVSQVLPILVEGLLADNNTTILMEQPEIHLHPNMQAELADFFIDSLNLQSRESSKIPNSYIIETHSEYILRRIRRRIAEGKIRASDVAVYFIKPRDKVNPESALLELKDISEDGAIEWPRDYYITEFEDEMAIIKSKFHKS